MCIYLEAVAQGCSVKNVFLEISENSQENACTRVSLLINLPHACCLRHATLLKKRLWHKCVPVNFAKFLRTSFLKEHLRWLLLTIKILRDTVIRAYLCLKQNNKTANFMETITELKSVSCSILIKSFSE